MECSVIECGFKMVWHGSLMANSYCVHTFLMSSLFISRLFKFGSLSLFLTYVTI